MFEELTRTAHRLERGDQIKVHCETDPDGYIDQVCPSVGCKFGFKIHMEDRNGKVDTGKMFCPLCGHTNSDQKWFTPKQQEYIDKVALAHVDRQLNRAMKADARRFNRQQPKDGFIRMHMSVEGQRKLIPPPPAAAEPMQMRVTCSKCSCRYAVIGAAFFCPACGHNDAEQMFHLSLDTRLNTLDQIPKSLADNSDRDTAENTVHALIDHALQHAIMAFQKYAETLYRDLLETRAIRQNAFQRLKGGSDLWKSATGKQYSDYLNESELATLTIAFQRRHLFAHNQGLVDQEYINRSGDTAYELGQRIVLQERHVREYIHIIRKLASSMRETVRENTVER